MYIYVFIYSYMYLYMRMCVHIYTYICICMFYRVHSYSLSKAKGVEKLSAATSFEYRTPQCLLTLACSLSLPPSRISFLCMCARVLVVYNASVDEAVGMWRLGGAAATINWDNLRG